MAEEVPAGPMHPYLWRLLVRWIRDQVKRFTRFERLQMAIPIGECDAVDRSTEVRRPAIRERRGVSTHIGSTFGSRFTALGSFDMLSNIGRASAPGNTGS